MTQNLVHHRAAYPFQGDSSASQLSFAAGTIIAVDVTKQGGTGWVWGTLFGSAQSGWCPESYLVVVQVQTPTTTPTSPSSPIHDGFSGPIMGGSKETHSQFRASAPLSKDDDGPHNPFAE